jgi:hypothetical protein
MLPRYGLHSDVAVVCAIVEHVYQALATDSLNRLTDSLLDGQGK